MPTVFATAGLAEYQAIVNDDDRDLEVVRVVAEDYSAPGNVANKFNATADSAGPNLGVNDAARYNYAGSMLVDITHSQATVILPLAFNVDAEAYEAWAVFIYIRGDQPNSEVLFIIQANDNAAQYVKALNLDVLSSIGWILGQAAPSDLTITTTVNVANLLNVPADSITGIIDQAHLGAGGGTDTTVLYGDNQWRTMPQYWYGTQAQYDAIANKDADVEYNIHE